MLTVKNDPTTVIRKKGVETITTQFHITVDGKKNVTIISPRGMAYRRDIDNARDLNFQGHGQWLITDGKEVVTVVT